MRLRAALLDLSLALSYKPIYPGELSRNLPVIPAYLSHPPYMTLSDFQSSRRNSLHTLIHCHRGWICWTQLIFGVIAQIAHLFFVPETRTTILLDREAKRRRTTDPTGQLRHKRKTILNESIYGPTELTPFKERFAPKKVLKTWLRPFEMFFTEPIVLCCSLLSGFSDSLIFTFLEAFTPVYKQWGFSTTQMAWAFVP